MKQVWYRYEMWEDYQNGMYEQNNTYSETKIKKGLELFKNETELYKAMSYVAKNWKYAVLTNLTNLAINYQAWLGQACNCYKNKCNTSETIQIWHLLTEKEREKANKVADKVFYEWKKNYEKETEDYQLSLFDEEEK